MAFAGWLSTVLAAVSCAGELSETAGLNTPEDRAAMKVIDDVLGVLGLERGESTSTALAVYAPGTAPHPDVEQKLQARKAARAAKDFATSDRIRDELAALGYSIKDTAGGKVEVSRKSP